MINITKKQKQVLRYFEEPNVLSLTLKDIACYLQLTKPATSYRLQSLVEKKLLEKKGSSYCLIQKEYAIKQYTPKKTYQKIANPKNSQHYDHYGHKIRVEIPLMLENIEYRNGSLYKVPLPLYHTSKETPSEIILT
jgi:predicted transcriptional regulator